MDQMQSETGVTPEIQPSVDVDKTSDDVTTQVVASVNTNKSCDLNLGANPGLVHERFQRRKRPRRKSKKGKYPYNKTGWQERKKDEGSNSSERAQRVRQMMFEHGQPVAPYNTNQFLMEDHARIDGRSREPNPYLNEQAPGASQGDQHSAYVPPNKPSRARDSSFSIDSDDDHFYSSPEDEQEFLTKEFWSAYENVHAERLYAMSKSEIIHEYLQLEEKYEKSIIEMRRLRGNPEEEEDVGINLQQLAANREERGPTEESEGTTDTSTRGDETAEQLRVSQLENKTLKQEMEELRKENKALHSLMEKSHSSSVDSESDSSSSSLSSSDTSDSDSNHSSKSGADSDKDKESVHSEGECREDAVEENNTADSPEAAEEQGEERSEAPLMNHVDG